MINRSMVTPTAEQSVYARRPGAYRDVPFEQWCSPEWQAANTITSLSEVQRVFPGCGQQLIGPLANWQTRGLRIKLTPYLVSLVERDRMNAPGEFDPIWRQSYPLRTARTAANRPDEYDPGKENWENPNEMISRIAQHKYTDRVLINTADSCLSYCTGCLRALQSQDPSERKGGVKTSVWQETLEAIAERPEIREVILSGGDPLVLSNPRLRVMLQDLRNLGQIKRIRIHTRAWLHNPYRIDEGLCQLLEEFDVTNMAIHIAHPQEITTDWQAAVNRVRRTGTMLLAQIPLLRDINDNANIIDELCEELIGRGVIPYYLLHCMPNIPQAAAQRTSVRRGVEIIQMIGRHLSHPAVPEYIIVGKGGKRRVPDQLDGTADFVYTHDNSGWPVIRFTNWRGEAETYLDAPEPS